MAFVLGIYKCVRCVFWARERGREEADGVIKICV